MFTKKDKEIFANRIVESIESGINNSESKKNASKIQFEIRKQNSDVQKRIDKIKDNFK